MTLAVVVMAAHYKRIIAETAVEKGIHSIVRIAVSAAVKLYSRSCQGILRSAADTSADKNICAVFFEESRQCAVSAFGSRHDFRTRYLAVSDIIELKKLSVTKMLEYLSVIKCYRNSHNTISFRFYLGAALSPGAAAAFAAAAKHIASARNRKRSAVDDTFRYLFTGNVVNFRSSSA